jgi:cytochrome c oxidase subunit IV
MIYCSSAQALCRVRSLYLVAERLVFFLSVTSFDVSDVSFQGYAMFANGFVVLVFKAQ